MITPDSSVVIAAMLPWHIGHRAARAALVAGERSLVAHVAFETTSVLSRMPKARRVAPHVALEALEHDFPRPWLVLDAPGARGALHAAVAADVRGGALYDALIAATARHHGTQLLSADRRARGTYEAVGADVRFLETDG